jgi:hypothetical protein
MIFPSSRLRAFIHQPVCDAVLLKKNSLLVIPPNITPPTTIDNIIPVGASEVDSIAITYSIHSFPSGDARRSSSSLFLSSLLAMKSVVN